jgi:hypothetical protein
MKRYFVRWIISVSMLALPGVASGQQNLQLILEGPLVLCENPGGQTLTVAIPNLQGTHYVPGFSSDLSDLPLAVGAGSQFPDVMDGMHSTMTIKAWTGTSAMVLNPTTRPGVAYYYSEYGDCTTENKSLESVSVNVPIPDEIWALNPTYDQVYITDHFDITAYKGECTVKGCPHASRLVLRYKNLVPGLNIVDIKTDCNNKTTPKNCTKNDDWKPFDMAPASVPIGNELQLLLSVEPMVDPDEEGHAKAAFRAASGLSGVYRDLNYSDTNTKAMKGLHEQDRGRVRPFNVVLHEVCQEVPMVLCKHTAGKACGN